MSVRTRCRRSGVVSDPASARRHLSTCPAADINLRRTTMSATSRAEKPVRAGFDGQQGNAGAAALEAIDRLDQLLREEVIPRLPGERTEIEDDLDRAAYDEED